MAFSLSEASGLFTEFYGGIKDSANYVLSEGDTPYVTSSAVTFKSNAPKTIPYWLTYKKFLAKATPDGTIAISPKLTFTDCGGAAQGGKTIAFDTLFNGHKTVFAYDASYMTYKTDKAVFQIDAQKEEALRNLNYQAAQTQQSMAVIGKQLAALQANQSGLNKDQLSFVTTVQKSYSNTLNNLTSTKGITVQPAAYTPPAAAAVSGIGVIPVILVVGVVAIAVVAIGAFVLEDIERTQANLKEYQDASDQQSKILSTYLTELQDKNLTPAQRADIQSKVDAIYKDSQKKQSTILSNQASSDPISNIKQIAELGVVGIGLFAVMKIVPMFKKSS